MILPNERSHRESQKGRTGEGRSTVPYVQVDLCVCALPILSCFSKPPWRAGLKETLRVIAYENKCKLRKQHSLEVFILAKN
jgi:hypothetical protein